MASFDVTTNVEPLGLLGAASITITVVAGDTLYYGDNRQVSAGSNLGSLTSGNSVTVSEPVWVVSASRSSVTVSYTYAQASGSGASVSSLVIPTQLFTVGHSISAGTTLNNIADRIPAKLATALGTTDKAAANMEVSGSLFMQDNVVLGGYGGSAHGSWVEVVQLHGLPQRPRAPYLSNLHLAMIMTGINDISVYGPVNAGMQEAWKQTILAAVARLRCGQIIDDNAGGTFTATTSSSTNPTVLTSVSSFANVTTGATLSGTGIQAGTTVTAVDTFAGTITMSLPATASGTGVTITAAPFTYTGASWSQVVSSGQDSSGTTFHQVTANGDSVSHKVAPDYDGQAIDFFFLGQVQANYATWTVTNGGTTLATGSNQGQLTGITQFSTNHPVLPFVLRVTTPNPSAYQGVTLTATISGVNGVGGFFDCVGYESNPAPLVIVADSLRPATGGYAIAYSSPKYMPVDADITALNTVNQAVAALFTDGRVVTDGADAALNKGGSWLHGLHPDERSCGTIAQLQKALVLSKLPASDVPTLGML